MCRISCRFLYASTRLRYHPCWYMPSHSARPSFSANLGLCAVSFSFLAGWRGGLQTIFVHTKHSRYSLNLSVSCLARLTHPTLPHCLPLQHPKCLSDCVKSSLNTRAQKWY